MALQRQASPPGECCGKHRHSERGRPIGPGVAATGSESCSTRQYARGCDIGTAKVGDRKVAFTGAETDQCFGCRGFDLLDGERATNEEATMVAAGDDREDTAAPLEEDGDGGMLESMVPAGRAPNGDGH